jgi:hypothetical protein
VPASGGFRLNSLPNSGAMEAPQCGILWQGVPAGRTLHKNRGCCCWLNNLQLSIALLSVQNLLASYCMHLTVCLLAVLQALAG